MSRNEGDVGRHRTAEDDGFGLVDCILALAILLVMLTASLALVSDVTRQAAESRERVAATEVAEEWLETLANSSVATLKSDVGHDVTEATQTVASVTFTPVVHMDWADTGSGNICKSGNPPQVITATVVVEWGANNSQSLSESTDITPPYGTAVPTDGYISVQISGATLSSPPAEVYAGDTPAVTTIPVTISGAGSAFYPDSNGCVFVQEPAGTYTVSLSSPPGEPQFIDWQENPAPSTSVTVAAGVTSSATFNYDEATSLTWSSAAAAPAATGMPVSVSNTHLNPLGWKNVVPAGSLATSVNVFPYATAGYSAVWYGDCAAEEPSNPTGVTVTPGGTATVSITGLATLELQVANALGVPIYGATATATVNDAADSCPADTFGLSPATGTVPLPSISDTAVVPETYKITVTDPGNGKTTTIAAVVTTTGVTVGGTTYPTGTPVPVTAP